MLNRYNFASSSFEFSTFLSSRNAKKIACSPHFHLLHLSGVILQDYLCIHLSICPQLEKMLLKYAFMDFCDTWTQWSSGGGQ